MIQLSQQTEIFDVFLVDGDFAIERPKRYYRKLDPKRLGHQEDENEDDHDPEEDPEAGDPIPDPNTESFPHEAHGTLTRFAGILHIGHHHDKHHSVNHDETHSAAGNQDQQGEDEKKAPKGDAVLMAGDPSTQPTELDKQAAEAISASRAVHSLATSSSARKKKATDVSQHTFFLQNSQRKLKFVAKNEASR